MKRDGIGMYMRTVPIYFPFRSISEQFRYEGVRRNNLRGGETMRKKKAIIFGFVLIGILFALLTGCHKDTPIIPDISDIHTSMTFGVTIDDACYHSPNLPYGAINLENSLREVDKAKELG